MNEYNDFDDDGTTDPFELFTENGMDLIQTDHDILAMGENNGQTVVVVASDAVEGTTLFKTFDKNRVVVAINMKLLTGLMVQNREEVVFLIRDAVEVGAIHFKWPSV